jgi:hypothetical protein
LILGIFFVPCPVSGLFQKTHPVESLNLKVPRSPAESFICPVTNLRAFGHAPDFYFGPNIFHAVSIKGTGLAAGLIYAHAPDALAHIFILGGMTEGEEHPPRSVSVTLKETV